MKVLLSIKPEFADRIFNGTKHFEFRRNIFKENVTTVVVYASSPIQMVIGEFEIEEIISDTVINLWRKTKKYAGIDRDRLFEYFRDKEEGYAIKIRNTRKYEQPLCIREDFNLSPPQSFLYLNNSKHE